MHTKQRNPAWDFKNQSERPDVAVDPNCGPGTYDEFAQNNIGDRNSIKYSHGVKYEQVI